MGKGDSVLLIVKFALLHNDHDEELYISEPH
jgi:hypothetical protein